MTGTGEKSRGKGAEKFLTVVTGRETGRIAWIAGGRSRIASPRSPASPARKDRNC